MVLATYTPRVYFGNMTIEEAMVGKNITVGVHRTSPAIYMQVNNVTGQWKPMSGFMLNVQNYIAQKYKVNFNYVVVKEPSVSWSKHLPNVLKKVDIYANNAFSDTTERRGLGITPYSTPYLFLFPRLTLFVPSFPSSLLSILPSYLHSFILSSCPLPTLSLTLTVINVLD